MLWYYGSMLSLDMIIDVDLLSWSVYCGLRHMKNSINRIILIILTSSSYIYMIRMTRSPIIDWNIASRSTRITLILSLHIHIHIYIIATIPHILSRITIRRHFLIDKVRYNMYLTQNSLEIRISIFHHLPSIAILRAMLKMRQRNRLYQRWNLSILVKT